MKKKLVALFILVSILFTFTHCSEVEDEISTPEELGGVHPDGFGKMGSENFHTKAIQSNMWDMTSCQKCHASDYSGGIANVSCLDCHTGNNGPESCNTCHGDFSDESRIAPPTDLDNNTSTSARGVGAHTSHVYETTMALGVGCYTCHPGNASDNDYIVSHSDGGLAEVVLSGDFAEEGNYDPETLTCSDTYCHGNFEFDGIKGNNFSPVWNIVDGTQAACGTCHGKDGTPTPVGHFGNFEATACATCHADAFNEDGTLNKFVHMNGEKDVSIN